jgi:ribose 5-phosphate isomerase B
LGFFTNQILLEDVMKVVIGADGGGFNLKKAIKEDLLKKGVEFFDINSDAPILFYEAAKEVSKRVQSREFERGIIICGTGMGVSIIANKHKGVYAALVECEYTARRSKTVNNTNVLCLGGMVLGGPRAVEMVNSWLNAKHMEGLDEEMARIVKNEFKILVDFENEVYG